MKKAIYTVNLGGYDFDPFPALGNLEWDKILFTDSRKVSTYGWNRIIYVNPTDRPDLKSRDIKFRSHIYLSEYDLVCYNDSNMRIIRELPVQPFKIKHGKRSSVREEADACNKQEHRWKPKAINAQMEYYESQGFPDESGLFLNGFFCRKHSEVENDLCNAIWEQLNIFSSRDQLALPYCIWKLGYDIPENEIFKFRFFRRWVQMRSHRNLKPTIYG